MHTYAFIFLRIAPYAGLLCGDIETDRKAKLDVFIIDIGIGPLILRLGEERGPRASLFEIRRRSLLL